MIKKTHILVIAILISINTFSQDLVEVKCQELFLSGTNLAWDQFGGDVGYSTNPDITYFDAFFADVKAAGGNSVRWWFHTDGSFTPEIESSGNVTGLHETYTNAQIIAQVESILDAAEANDIYVTISLFSFDMLQDYSAKGWTGNDFTGNKPFFQSETNIQSYIDNGLTEMVTALKDHPGLGSWEIFNEPEGMTSEFGWTGNQGGEFISITDVQLTVNMLTDAIHNADPDALVTNGAWAMRVNTDVGSYTNYYSDANLLAIGSNNYPNGTLDYYQVHYYDWQPSSMSPFAHPASYWNLDKPIVIGEFHADEASTALGVSDNSPYEWLYDNGYAGAWGWQYNTTALWAAIEPQVAYMYAQNPTVVTIDPDACLSAEFSADDTEICETDNVTYTASSSSSAITSWSWDFDDGQTANTEGPHVITYSAPGTYTVSLITSDGVNGDTVTKTDYITVVQNSTVNIIIDGVSACPNAVVFNAVITPSIAGGSKRWYLNGVYQISFSGLTFSPATINSGDQVRFEVSDGSLSTCYSGTLVSETLTVDCGGLSVDDYYLSTVSIYPNPATNLVEISGLQDEASIQVFSMIGKQLIQQKLIDNKIDITNLPIGIYFIKVTTDKGQITKRLVKQ